VLLSFNKGLSWRAKSNLDTESQDQQQHRVNAAWVVWSGLRPRPVYIYSQ